MSTPIHDRWWNRPHWGEYLALRGGKPTHAGFDSYTTPRATVYGTADNGRVIAKGYVGGMQWGYYIDVHYAATAFRKQYVQRDCHLFALPSIAVGAKVTTQTAIGEVGRTGNARDIFWPANESPNGEELWHLHSEVYNDSAVFNTAKRVNPLTVWGATLAGGGTELIPDPPKRKKRNMGVLYNYDGKQRWAHAGTSPGTPANWRIITDVDQVNRLAAEQTGGAVKLTPTEWAKAEKDYLAPVQTTAVLDYQKLGDELARALAALPSAQVPSAEDIATAVNNDAAERLRH